MAILAFTPYLFLYGKAEAAIALYQRALGAQLEMLQRFGEVQHDCPDAMRNLVMHAELSVGDTRLMLSDSVGEGPDTSQHSPVTTAVAVGLDEPDTMRKAFRVLAEHGTVQQELIEAPFGWFGSLIDEFGVNWMFQCPSDTEGGQ